MKIKIVYTFVAAFLTSQFLLAAPIPTTSSSVLGSAENGHFFKGLGFSMKTKGTTWVALQDEDSFLTKSARLGPAGTGKSDEAPRLTVRIDSLSKNSNLETYAKKWMRDYGNFGFETLGTQPIKIGGGKGLVVDLVQKSKNKQLRQVILNKEKDSRVAILTCVDQKSNFNQTLPICNQIINTFEWNNSDKTNP